METALEESIRSRQRVVDEFKVKSKTPLGQAYLRYVRALLPEERLKELHIGQTLEDHLFLEDGTPILLSVLEATGMALAAEGRMEDPEAIYKYMRKAERQMMTFGENPSEEAAHKILDKIASWVCSICGKPMGKLCAGCKKVRYCSTECQKSDWAEHKAKCKEDQG